MSVRKTVKAFALEPELVSWLDSYSRSERVSKSYIVRELLGWLKKEMEGENKV